MHLIRSAGSCASLLVRLTAMTESAPNQLVDFVFSNPIIAELRPSIALEIGTAHGGTLYVISRLSQTSATIISLDMPGGTFGGGYRWFRIPIYRLFPGRKQKLHLVRGDSHDPATQRLVQARMGENRKLDLLFIDGDHTYEGVKADFEAYAPLVRS